jgi:hypothetical protein
MVDKDNMHFNFSHNIFYAHSNPKENFEDMIVDIKKPNIAKTKPWYAILLVVEPDYLPDSEVFYFHPCLYPMKYLHPRSMYTLPRGEV